MPAVAFSEESIPAGMYRMPVVLVSTLTTKGASVTLLALVVGAVDFVA